MGRGIIVELAPDALVIAGTGFHVALLELTGSPRDAEILSLEEGTFDGKQWMRARRLNGDELQLTFTEKARTLRVRLLW